MAEETPEWLALVDDFVNSIDVEAGSDEFGTVGGLRDWLAAHGHPADPNESDLAGVLAFREALREEIAAHDDPGIDVAGARERLNRAAARVPLRLDFDRDGAGMRLVPVAGPGVDGLLGAVLAEILLAERDGVWRRFKICHADTCRWAFYDRSKNSSRRWCSMGVCGNRSKTRAYRGRRRDG